MTTLIPFGEISLEPAAIGSQGNAVLGIRDSGKTYTATVLAEGMHDSGIPFVAFDPVGVWCNLRVPGPGTAGRGYPVVVAGGRAGDLPITPDTCEDIVRAAMVNGVSLVIDLFDIHLSKADWRKIVMRSVRVLLHENQAHGLRHVFIEEAAEFAPQKVMDGHVYAEVEKLARMGGNSRLGYTLINQRAEEVNKAVLELCDNLFLHRQKGRNSLTALGKWLNVGQIQDARPILESLPTLPNGECWAWLAGSDQPVHVHVPEKRSAHPDRRTMRAEDVAGARKPVDVAAFVDKMKAALAPAAETPVAEPAKHFVPGPAEQELIDAEERGYKRGLSEGTAAGEAQGFVRGQQFARTQVQVALRDLPLIEEPIAPGSMAKIAMKTAARPTPEPAPPAGPEGPAPDGVSGPQAKVLRSLLWWRAVGIEAPTRSQVAIVAGWSPNSSNIRDRASELVSAGLVDRPASGALGLTAKGRELARILGADGRMATNRVDAVRAILTGPQTLVFNALLQRPDGASRDDVAIACGWSTSSSNIRDRASELVRLELVTRPRPGWLKLEDWVTA